MPDNFFNLDNHKGGIQRTLAEGATVLDVFAPPRDEYRKAGSGFGA